MSTFHAIMIIWLGIYGKAQTLSVEKFETMVACEQAKAAIVRHYEEAWYPLKNDDIACIAIK